MQLISTLPPACCSSCFGVFVETVPQSQAWLEKKWISTGTLPTQSSRSRFLPGDLFLPEAVFHDFSRLPGPTGPVSGGCLWFVVPTTLSNTNRSRIWNGSRRGLNLRAGETYGHVWYSSRPRTRISR